MGLNNQETMAQRVGPFGVNMGGELFDDNGYHGVRSVKVGFEDGHLVYMEINYVRNGHMEMEQVSHGVMPSVTAQFAVADYPNEFITRVEGTSASLRLLSGHDPLRMAPDALGYITSIRFITNKGITSLTFGNATNGESEFTMSGDGAPLVGFFGRTRNAIHCLGTYFSLIPSVGFNKQIKGSTSK